MQWVLAACVSGVVLGVVLGDVVRPLGASAWSGWPWGMGAVALCGVLGATRAGRGWVHATPWPWCVLIGVLVGVGLHVSAPAPDAGLPVAWRGVQTRLVRVAGVVDEGARPRRDGRARAVVALRWCDEAPCQGRVSVALPSGVRAGVWSPGAQVVVRGVWRGFAEADAPYGFDGRRWAAREGLSGAVRVKRAEEAVVLRPGAWWERGLDGARQAREAWAIARFGEERAALLLALVTGSRGLVTAARRAPVDEAGLSHLLAISGLHLMTVAGLGLAVRWALVRWRPAWACAWWGRLWAEAMPLMGVASYGALAGWPVSARRAATMLVCWTVGRWVGREASLGTSLSVAVLGVLVWDSTWAVFDPGLQLSVCAVAGIGLGLGAEADVDAGAWIGQDNADADEAADVAKTRGRVGVWVAKLGRAGLGWAKAGLVVTAATNAACLPWLVMHFGRVPLVGALLNLVAVPLVQCVALPMGLVALVLGPHGPGAWAGEASLWALGCVEAMARACPGAGFGAGMASPWAVVLGLGGAAVAWGRWRRPRWGLACVAAGALASAVGWGGVGGAGELVAVPVGQGDALVIRADNGATVLVDAGGRTRSGWEAGGRVVVPALRRMGVHRLDAVLVSHGDLDHIGGLEAVVRELRPAVVWWSAPRGVTASERAVLRAAREVGAAVREPPQRVRLSASVGLRRLDAVDAYGFREALGRNERSAVWELELGRLRVLLTGDVERLGEWDVLGRVRPVHVLKVAHHGSRTSSTAAFVARARPRWALIQAGRDNRFGHPHPDVVERLEAARARVVSTVTCGQVVVRVQGAKVELAAHKRCDLSWRVDPDRPPPNAPNPPLPQRLR